MKGVMKWDVSVCLCVGYASTANNASEEDQTGQCCERTDNVYC